MEPNTLKSNMLTLHVNYSYTTSLTSTYLTGLRKTSKSLNLDISHQLTRRKATHRQIPYRTTVALKQVEHVE